MNLNLRPTWVEIDLRVIAENVRLLRAKTAVSARLMSIVKADGYGHGAVRVARTALDHGATHLGVAMVEEGVRLREGGIDAPILVLGAIEENAAPIIAEYGLSQTVCDAQTATWLAKAARYAGWRVDVHLKVDTGMGRLGVRSEKELLALAETISLSRELRIKGVYTHLATADEADTEYVGAQVKRFDAMTRRLRAAVEDIMAHVANSAALLRFPQMHYDMARAGIAQYLCPQLPEDAGAGLEQAMRWVTHGAYCKEIGEGESVSYGAAFTARRPTRVLTIPVGYADGYRRCIGGKGYALVWGKRAPVIGRVCMDQAMLDVTDIPGAGVGDEVVLLGRQGDAEISAAEMAGWCDTIDYEMLLSPSARVPRVYV